MLQLLLWAIAIVCAFLGIVTHHGLWLLAAMFGMALSAIRHTHLSVWADAERLQSFLQKFVGTHWQLILYCSFLLSAISGLIVAQLPLSRLSILPWGGALVLLGVAIWVHERPTPVQWLRQSLRLPVHAPGWNRVDWLVILLLGLVAFAFRIYRLDATFPPAREDEGFQGLLTLQALYGPQPQPQLASAPLPLFGAGWFGHPTLFYFIQAGTMQLFGVSLIGLRMLAVLVGTACAPTIYILGKIGWGRVAGFSAAWLLAVSHFHIQYSRMALQNIETVWLMLVLGCCLLMIERNSQNEMPNRQRITWFVATGLVIGINQYFYVGARFAFILAAPLLLFLLLRRKVGFYPLAMMTLVIITVLFPQIIFYIQHPEHLTVRSQGVNIFTEENIQRILGTEASLRTAWPALIVKQFQAHWRFWVDQGDTSPFYWGGLPAFDPVTITLFWLGLGLVVIRCYRFPEMLAGIWWVVGAVTAGLLTLNPTWGARLVIIAPAVYLIGGIFVHEVFVVIRHIWPRTTWLAAAATIGCLGVAVPTYLNFTAYFQRYAFERPGLDIITVAEPMAAHAKDYVSYLLGSSTNVNQGVIRFIAYGAELHNLPTIEQLDELLAKQDPQKGMLFVAQPPRQDDLTVIEARFPGGVRQTYTDPKGQLSLITYEVPLTVLTEDHESAESTAVPTIVTTMQQTSGDEIPATPKPSVGEAAESPLSPLAAP